jgi:probable HAF family extracellular repeat protein
MKSKVPLLTAALFALLVIVSRAPAREQSQPGVKLPHYTVTDLGTLGGTFSWATGINNKGEIDGFSTTPDETCIPPLPGCNDHAFFWRDGEITDLGTLGGPNSGVSFWGRRPNEFGAVAGAAQTSTLDPTGEDFCAFINNFFSESPAPHVCLPTIWIDGAMFPLPSLGNNGAASQINNRWQVTGEIDGQPTCPPGTPHPRPVLWENGVLHKLPRLAGFPYGGPNAINDKGKSVGVLVNDCAATVAHAVLWDSDGATYLGDLGGTAFDEGVAINDAGEAVGFASLPGNTVWHAFSWTRGLGMKDLGTLPGDVLSFAAGINEEDQIVGTSFDADGNSRAFIEQDGVMTDLNTLTAPNSPLYLLYGFDINSHGEIVGLGLVTATQEYHAFLARPCTEAEGWKGSEAANAAFRAHVDVPENARKLLMQHLRFGRFGTPPTVSQ